ncbi:MAG: pilus assembly protein PilM [Nitrospiraceae bacterium]
MVAECVGLDLGRTAIKAVRFRRALSGRESIEYFHHPLPFTGQPALKPAQRVGALRTFLWRNGLYSDNLVSAIPCSDLFIRTLSFPFRDANKLAQVVPFEIENMIPLPLEDVAVGSMVLPPSGFQSQAKPQTVSDVLVAAAPKSTVADHIQMLSEADIEPTAINVDGLALYSVTEHLKREGASVPPDLAIVDVGASKTILCLLHQGRPWLLRTIAWGGDYLTDALAKRQVCSLAEAERQKRGMSVPQVESWLDPLIKDIRVTLHAYEASTKTKIKHCWVSGGGSKLKQLPGFLSNQLELSPLGPRQGFGADCPRAFSVAFGLALHPNVVRPRWRSRSTIAVDFKQVSADAARTDQDGRRELHLAIAGAVIVGLLGFVDLYARVTLQQHRVTDLKEAVHAQHMQHFGGAALPGDELDDARRKMAAITKSLALIDGSQSHVLPVLAQIVKHVPQGTPLKVRELTIETGQVHLEAETTSFEAIERVKQAFAASPSFHEVTVSDTRVGSSPNQVVFRVAFKVQAP